MIKWIIEKLNILNNKQELTALASKLIVFINIQKKLEQDKKRKQLLYINHYTIVLTKMIITKMKVGQTFIYYNYINVSIQNNLRNIFTDYNLYFSSGYITWAPPVYSE
jgi:hypothetical protein